jgi:hypothetical protein
MSKADQERQPTFNEIMNKAAASALRGGVAGAAAMGANVACLMWMRTTVSFLFCWSNELASSYTRAAVVADRHLCYDY